MGSSFTAAVRRDPDAGRGDGTPSPRLNLKLLFSLGQQENDKRRNVTSEHLPRGNNGLT